MKKAFLYLLIATSAVISCKKEKTDEPVPEASPITIFVEEDAPTKALLNDAGLKTNGNKIHVIDLLTGFSGTASWMSGNKYIDDEIVSRSGAMTPAVRTPGHQMVCTSSLPGSVMTQI